jgi:hypothetical protein
MRKFSGNNALLARRAHEEWNAIVLNETGPLKSALGGLAPRHGFEPRFTAPKAAVLPLDDRGMLAGLQDSV